MKIYPWQLKQWQQLLESFKFSRLHHSLLFYGYDGMGLSHFARCFALSLLNKQLASDGTVTEQGRDAELFLAGTHPDLFYLQPESGSRVIKVEQMRNMIEFLHFKSHAGNFKIVIIEPADAMNISSANGLLKTLEEPPESSIIILNTSLLTHIPLTIKSRCQLLFFSAENNQSNQDWLAKQLEGTHDEKILLKLAGNPLTAIKLLKTGQLELRQRLIDDLYLIRCDDLSPLQVVQTWKEYDYNLLILWLQKIFSDLVRLSISSSKKYLQNIDLTENLNLLRKGLDLILLLDCVDAIKVLRRRLNGGISFNREALLEEFLIFWQGLKIKYS